MKVFLLDTLKTLTYYFGVSCKRFRKRLRVKGVLDDDN